MHFELVRLPHLKMRVGPRKGHIGRNARMLANEVRDRYPPIAIQLQETAIRVKIE